MPVFSSGRRRKIAFRNMNRNTRHFEDHDVFRIEFNLCIFVENPIFRKCYKWLLSSFSLHLLILNSRCSNAHCDTYKEVSYVILNKNARFIVNFMSQNAAKQKFNLFLLVSVVIIYCLMLSRMLSIYILSNCNLHLYSTPKYLLLW